MKRPLLSALFAVSATSCIVAQPTLTQPYAYTPGNIITSYGVDSVGVQPGSSGANQTWNFTTISIGASSTNTALAPSATPYASSFPTATVAFDGGNGKYQYWRVTGTSAWLLGQQDPTQAQIYQDTHHLFNYPFSWNTTVTDPVIICNYTVNGMPFYRTGTSTTAGDGYGTLLLPGTSISNVARVHFTYQYKDSVDFGGGFSSVTYTNVNQYLFFTASDKSPVLGIYYLSVGSPGNMVDTKIVSVSNLAVGLAEQNPVANFNLFPNPAVNNSAVQFDLKASANVTYEIRSYTGQKVQEGSFGALNAGSQKQTLDMADLAAGIYIIALNADGIITEQKLIIQK